MKPYSIIAPLFSQPGWSRRVCSLLVALCTGIAVQIVIQTAQAEDTCPALDEHNIIPYIGTWQGRIGEAFVQVQIEQHAEDAQRVQGHYIYLDQPEHLIRIAGEPFSGVLEIEESANGTDISGLWDLKFPTRATDLNLCFTQLQGMWQDAQFSNQKTLTLTRHVSW